MAGYNKTTAIPRPTEDYYKMNHGKRRCAHIFNHIADAIDKNRIERTLIQLRFEVEIYDNFTYQKIILKLEQISVSNYNDVDCVMIVVITHGSNQGIQAADREYCPEELWDKFTSDNCPYLAGKPKIFIVDACRGTKVNKGTEVEFYTMPFYRPYPSLKIPTTADILVVYSTQPGFYGFANKDGSWFVQALCAELVNKYQTTEFLHILTFVNRKIAFDFQGRDIKQMSSIVSSLTRLLYLGEPNTNT